MEYEIRGGSFPIVICTLQKGETMKNETGAMSFMTSNMKMETNTGGGLMKGPGRALFGEGLSFSKLTGPGKIWIQTMPLSKLAAALIPYIPTSSDSSDFGGLFD